MFAQWRNRRRRVHSPLRESALKVIYISQGNIPSKWAHTFQAMKMAEGLAKHVDCLTLVTGGGLFSSRTASVDLTEWYGLRYPFRVKRLPVHWRLSEPFFAGYRYPKFDWAAVLFARFRFPDLVFTRSPYAGYLSAKVRLNTILETHIEIEHPEFHHVVAACHSPHLHGVVTVTNYLRDSYVQAGVPEAKAVVCPDGVDLASFANLASPEVLRKELGLPIGQKIATYCGHLYEHKGVYCIFEAARQTPTVLFCLVGGWPNEIARCRAAAQDLRNVRFMGFVPNRQIPKYIKASDFLLLPNSMRHAQANTTSPLKLFEYMASERPIIASRIPAFRQLLRHKRNAYMVEPDSGKAIHNAICRLCKAPELCREISSGAWRDVQGFTWSNRARQVLGCFGVKVGRRDADCLHHYRVRD